MAQDGDDDTSKIGDDYEREDGSIDYDRMEEDHGRDYVEAEVAESLDPEGIEYLNATDTGCTNEELGLDEDGNREDD